MPIDLDSGQLIGPILIFIVGGVLYFANEDDYPRRLGMLMMLMILFVMLLNVLSALEGLPE